MYYPIYDVSAINSMFSKLAKVTDNADELFNEAIIKMQDTEPKWHDDITITADEGVKVPAKVLREHFGCEDEASGERVIDTLNHRFGVELSSILDKHTS